jgi:hypothetical protein
MIKPVDRAAQSLLPFVIASLRAVGIKATRQKALQGLPTPAQPDGCLRIGFGKQHIDYVVEAKRTLTTDTLGGTLTQLRQLKKVAKAPSLLVTNYVAPPLAERLKEEKQQFADAAGNAYLTGPGLFIYISGRKPALEKPDHRGGGALTSAGIKVLYALICDPALVNKPYRSIAAAAGVALGATPKVLADLKGHGFLRTAGRTKKRSLNANRRLLDEWSLAYAHTLRPKTLLGRYIVPEFSSWLAWELDPTATQWGAEPAANRLIGHLIPGLLTIYADKLPGLLIVQQRLIVADPTIQEGILELRKPFWGSELKPGEQATVVPPPLIYADLLATGDSRCIDTAEMIYARYLARLFPAA